jgi:hypothetical protein
MVNPRAALESAMIAKLALIGPANGDNVPKAIWQVTTKEILISQVADEFRPTIVFLTEEGASEFVGLGGVKQTTLSVAMLIYLTITPIEEGSILCTQYTDAVANCLDKNRYWGGLALITEITGVPTHQMLTVPDAIATVFADVRYRYEGNLA